MLGELWKYEYKLDGIIVNFLRCCGYVETWFYSLKNFFGGSLGGSVS